MTLRATYSKEKRQRYLKTFPLTIQVSNPREIWICQEIEKIIATSNFSTQVTLMMPDRCPNLLWRKIVTGMLSLRVNIAFTVVLRGRTLKVHKQMPLYPFSRISHMDKVICKLFFTVNTIRLLRLSSDMQENLCFGGKGNLICSFCQFLWYKYSYCHQAIKKMSLIVKQASIS
jgi:hypothetical protein